MSDSVPHSSVDGIQEAMEATAKSSRVVRHQVQKLVADGVADPRKLLASAAADVRALSLENHQLHRALADLLVLYDHAAGNVPRQHGYTFDEIARLADIRQLAAGAL